MRKIVSREEGAKRNKRNQLIIGGVLILVMVASVLGYAFGRETQDSTDTEKVIYNGLEFTKTGNLWNTNTGSYQFSFLYNPEETGKINSVLNPLSSYSNKPLYIYSKNNEAGMEIYRNLFYQNQIVQRVQNACLEGEKCEDETFPIKNCTDNLIIIIRENNQSDIPNQNKSSIKQQNNCVFIEGNIKNLTQLSDSFLFKITGIQ